jgi:peptidoglycan/xylan/chitin deacetylase (PgdA/CDA1 family)
MPPEGAMTAVPVLLFHGVRDEGDDYAVTRARFTEYVGRVAACGRTPVTVAEVSRRLAAGEPVDGLVSVSFDDGDASQLPAAEELAASGIPTSVYVTVDYLNTPGYLDAAGLRDLAAVPGIEVGSHSVQHVHLDCLSREDLRRNLRGSRSALEDGIGREVRGLAYPHGSHDRSVMTEATAAGYTSGAAVKNALSHDREHPLSVSRLTITMDTPLDVVAAFLRGEGRLGEVRPRLRTRGFRYYRKLRHRLGQH